MITPHDPEKYDFEGTLKLSILNSLFTAVAPYTHLRFLRRCLFLSGDLLLLGGLGSGLLLLLLLSGGGLLLLGGLGSRSPLFRLLRLAEQLG